MSNELPPQSRQSAERRTDLADPTPLGILGRVWITDRGVAGAANLAWLRETGRPHIIGAPN